MNLIDTDVIIEMIRQKKYRSGIISPITLIEVLRGIEAEKRSRVKRLLEESFSVLNLDNSIIEMYCNIYVTLKSQGISIPDADLLIASSAIAHNLFLETKDEHFLRLETMGLRLEQSRKAGTAE